MTRPYINSSIKKVRMPGSRWQDKICVLFDSKQSFYQKKVIIDMNILSQ